MYSYPEMPARRAFFADDYACPACNALVDAIFAASDGTMRCPSCGVLFLLQVNDEEPESWSLCKVKKATRHLTGFFRPIWLMVALLLLPAVLAALPSIYRRSQFFVPRLQPAPRGGLFAPAPAKSPKQVIPSSDAPREMSKMRW